MSNNHNIWEDDMSDTPPPIEYTDLIDVISFAGFDYNKYREGEDTILTPRLERLGYTRIKWSMGEFDSFGPLSRVCQAHDKNGIVRWFVYG
jgi:hypothetical protein